MTKETIDSLEALNKHSLACEQLQLVVYRLRKIADGFELTGNYDMAQELSSIATIIDICEKNASDAFSDEIRLGYENARQMTGTLLKATLAVAEREKGG